MNLFHATRQWAQRPADERFASLADLHAATKKYADVAAESVVPWESIRLEKYKDDVQLVGRTGVPAKLTHWAFGQLCAKVGAPAAYLRELPATMATQNLNYGLAKQSDASDAVLMFHQNGGLLLRAITSERYSRIWNYEIAERLIGMQRYGWEPARPDTHWGASDVGTCIMCSGSGNSTDGKCKYCVGTGKEYPALYASDHDIFAFIRNRSAILKEPGNPDGLQRGFIVENSEVGASALKFTKFLYREMCGNHIIWGATKVVDISIRHVGTAREQFELYAAEVKKYAESSASEEEFLVKKMKTKILAKTKEEVLDMLFGKRRLQLTRKTLESGYNAVKPEEDGDPRSQWGIVQGITRFSQSIPYADQRAAIDKAAGKILQIQF